MNIIELAREAGFHFHDAGYAPAVLHTEPHEYSQKCFERFAHLIRAAALAEPAEQPVAWLHPANASCVTTDPTAYSRGIPLYKSPQPAKREPLTDERAQFNAAINFAIDQGTDAAVFLRAWREGDTSEWPEFDAHGITKEGA